MEKVAYTKGELAAEIVSALIAAGTVVCDIVLVTGGKGGAAIFAVAALICYGAFSICSLMPQWENTAMYNPEKATEKRLHNTRKGCIAAKIIITGALLILSFI